ncbi:MAG: DNA-binding protein [Acidimicrobiia bacterium]|nr:DNA-binding protein [Acidimicrobiia bacterium]
MKTYQFTLIVDGPDLQTDELIDSLYEAGCDDALVGRTDSVQYLDFDRQATSIDEAILSAVADIELIDGLEVIRLADAGLVAMADIAVRTGRTRESVRLLVAGDRGPGGFPAPATDPRGRYRLWRWPDVERWFATELGDNPPGTDDHLVAAINAGLELRHHGRRITPERETDLRELVGL